jgi:hypothetical protein
MIPTHVSYVRTTCSTFFADATSVMFCSTVASVCHVPSLGVFNVSSFLACVRTFQIHDLFIFC